MALEDKWAELAEEQKAKVKACKTSEELISLAEEEGFELTDDELEAVVGGSSWLCDFSCPIDEDSCLRWGKGAS